jgi:hypothetical protein
LTNKEQFKLQEQEIYIQILEDQAAQIKGALDEAEWKVFKAQLSDLAPAFQDVLNVTMLEKAVNRLLTLLEKKDRVLAAIAPAIAGAAGRRPNPKPARALKLQGIANRFYVFCTDPEAAGKANRTTAKGRSVAEPSSSPGDDLGQDTRVVYRK